jgi:hypothetical protein
MDPVLEQRLLETETQEARAKLAHLLARRAERLQDGG